MNIEKIKNYNQKMLAVFSTMIVTAAGIGLISLIIFIISGLIPNKRPTTNTLLADDKVEELKKDSLRQQIISYDTPRLVDTLNLIYLLPVNVKTLEKPEEMDKEVIELYDMDYKMSSGRKFSGKRFYGAFNNLIVYDYKNSTSFKISDSRFIGTDLSFEYFDDEIIIVFTGAESDTDKDKNITLLDFKSLFVYSLKTRELKKVSIENSTVNEIKYIENQKDILITFGYDRNKNNKFDSDIEPTFVMKYDYKKDKLIPIVDKVLEKDLQKIIDKN
ncbi:MAG: hypothetical protein HOO91_21235 [Bacteroidales bacterium]|nr:hypothetical protein [Bacteroidales bacterium]